MECTKEEVIPPWRSEEATVIRIGKQKDTWNAQKEKMCNNEYVRRLIPKPPPRPIPLPTPPASTSLMLTTKTNSPDVNSLPPVSTALILYTNTDSPMLIQESPAAPIHVLQAEHEPAHEDNDKTRTIQLTKKGHDEVGKTNRRM